MSYYTEDGSANISRSEAWDYATIEDEEDYDYTTAVDIPLEEYKWPLWQKPFTGAGEDELPLLDNLNITDNIIGMDNQPQ
ncbi:hypothetical protein WOLCODRAFT_152491 [Wolfiporia cocos MD-104 SS10]|uniref:Uncharacterized protein n=1 Tax=Wolfiporia cocos (strain MD-104) TaxID=742152 RepID=A0A2H3JKR5_WOLCO|nr:hypothetical protein WOLCODRAFT_152491 [Wolfiporia cocos MD-104 SS10]